MASKLKSNFAVQAFEQRHARSSKLPDFLAVYLQHYAPEHRTRSNELLHFLESQIPGRRIVYFGLTESDRPCGFATLMYYPETMLIIIDHMVVAPNMRGYGAFYAFCDMIATYIEQQRILYDHVCAEVIIGRPGSSESTKAQTLVRLMRQIGFKVAKIVYYAPDPQAVANAESCRSVLMLASEPERSEIDKVALDRIIDTIYDDHYLKWYEAIWTADKFEQYRRAIEPLKSKVKAGYSELPHVVLNGMKNLEMSFVVDHIPRPSSSMMGYLLLLGLPAAVGIAVGIAQEPMVAVATLVIAILTIVGGVLHPRFRRSVLSTFRPKE